MDVRVEEAADWSAVYTIYAEAFGQLIEAELVRQLHDDGDLILSLIARGDEPAGHIAFSHLALPETPTIKGAALAPLAVRPAFQAKGVGYVLVRHSLEQLKSERYDLVVVLGDPDYYNRFGFTPRLASRLKTPYDGPYLQALALSEKGKEAHGLVSYARAFAELK